MLAHHDSPRPVISTKYLETNKTTTTTALTKETAVRHFCLSYNMESARVYTARCSCFLEALASSYEVLLKNESMFVGIFSQGCSVSITVPSRV